MSKSQRRKIEWHTSTNGGASSSPTPPPAFMPDPPSVMDYLPLAQQKKRSRHWERNCRPHQATYRGIKPEVREAVKSAANALLVTADEIARAFLEYGTTEYQYGKLQLNPRPKAARMTLYPNSVENKKTPVRGVKKGSKGKPKKADWEALVSYRGIPTELQQVIRQIAADLNVPLGEVVSYLLHYALTAYLDGRLALNPRPRRTSMTLYEEPFDDTVH